MWSDSMISFQSRCGLAMSNSHRQGSPTLKYVASPRIRSPLTKPGTGNHTPDGATVLRIPYTLGQSGPHRNMHRIYRAIHREIDLCCAGVPFHSPIISALPGHGAQLASSCCQRRQQPLLRSSDSRTYVYLSSYFKPLWLEHHELSNFSTIGKFDFYLFTDTNSDNPYRAGSYTRVTEWANTYNMAGDSKHWTQLCFS